MELETMQFGNTGIQVTRLGYGALEIIHIPEDEVNSLLNLVLDSGINFIDTGMSYGNSEELLGKYISHRRSEFFLASKCGCVIGLERNHIFTRDNIVAGINQSLKRMKTDYLDLVQLHSSPSKDEIEKDDVIQTLMDIKKEGKVRFIGSSSTLPFLADHVDMEVFDAFQIPYSGLNRKHEEWISNALKSGAGTIIRGGVSRGEDENPTDQENKGEWENYRKANLDELLDEGESRTAFILRFALSHPHLNTTIVGTKNTEHFKENINTANKGKLSEDIYEEAKKRLSAIGAVPA
jgi:aryl-alcohol dehydrogenase-like predicted oxidoreductase